CCNTVSQGTRSHFTSSIALALAGVQSQLKFLTGPVTNICELDRAKITEAIEGQKIQASRPRELEFRGAASSRSIQRISTIKDISTTPPETIRNTRSRATRPT